MAASKRKQAPPAPGTPDTGALGGRHALVTGASRGIGWAVAQRLAAAGAAVSLIGRDAALLEQRAVELGEQYGTSAGAFPADVTDAAAIAAALRHAVALLGPIDILVNNAGFGASQPFAKMTAAHWGDMLAVNLSSVFHVTRAAIPGMLEQDSGRVINIASTAGITGYGYVAAYCAAKHGVVGLTRALAREYARTGITVNAVCPGYVDTDMTATTVEIIMKNRPFGRCCPAGTGRQQPAGAPDTARRSGRRRHVACRPGAASVTGQCIVVAGGEVMS